MRFDFPTPTKSKPPTDSKIYGLRTGANGNWEMGSENRCGSGRCPSRAPSPSETETDGDLALIHFSATNQINCWQFPGSAAWPPIFPAFSLLFPIRDTHAAKWFQLIFIFASKPASSQQQVNMHINYGLAIGIGIGIVESAVCVSGCLTAQRFN